MSDQEQQEQQEQHKDLEGFEKSLGIDSVPEEDKMKFIYNAIEQGFTVKRVPDKENSYEFAMSLGSRKFPKKDVSKKNSEGRRSLSMPITKKEYIQKIFVTNDKSE